MKPLELTLHGVSLACIVALGAGLFHVGAVAKREPPPLPPAGAASARTDDSRKLEADLRKLQSDLDSVRAQMADLQADRDALKARLETLRAAPASAEAPAADSGTLVAALEDPKVKERLAAMVKESLEADRQQRRNRDDRGWLEGHIQALSNRLGFTEPQKTGVTKLSVDLREKFDALRGQVRDKKLTADQARDLLKHAFHQADPQLQALLTPEQYTKYVAEVQPLQDRMILGIAPGK